MSLADSVISIDTPDPNEQANKVSRAQPPFSTTRSAETSAVARGSSRWSDADEDEFDSLDLPTVLPHWVSSAPAVSVAGLDGAAPASASTVASRRSRGKVSAVGEVTRPNHVASRGSDTLSVPTVGSSSTADNWRRRVESPKLIDLELDTSEADRIVDITGDPAVINSAARQRREPRCQVTPGSVSEADRVVDITAEAVAANSAVRQRREPRRQAVLGSTTAANSLSSADIFELAPQATTDPVAAISVEASMQQPAPGPDTLSRVDSAFTLVTDRTPETSDAAHPSLQATHRSLSSSLVSEGDSSEVVARCCVACGLHTHLVYHKGSSAWVCNNRPAGEQSCALRLIEFSSDGRLGLSPDSRWGTAEVVCRITSEDDVRKLCAVCDGIRLTILRSDAATPGIAHPAVAGGILSPWLCGSDLVNEVEALIARGRTHRRRLRQEGQILPMQHTDGGSYVKYFAPLLASVSDHDNASGLERARSGIHVVWSEGLQGPVASFEYNSGGHRDDLKLQERVHLERMRDDEPPWVASAAVVQISEGMVVVAVLDCTDGLLAIDLKVSGPFTVTPQQLSVAIDRMQTAISMFAIDEATGCSPWVHQALLGQRTPPMPVWVKTPPPCGRSLPPPSDAQAAAVHGSLVHPLFRVVGPPGTGKTVTLIRVVHALAHQERGQVLVCAPSNVAVDRAAIGIHRLGLSVIRVVASSRDASVGVGLPSEVFIDAHTKESERLSKLRTLKQQVGTLTTLDERAYRRELKNASTNALLSAAVIVCTCSTAGNTLMAGQRFDAVVVDEAAQAVEPELLIPLRAGPRRVVLVGDAQQLGPVVKCERAKNNGYGVSLFERLQSMESPSVFLNVQHRMHPAISAFPSAEFYKGELLDGPSTSEVREDVSFPWPSSQQPTFFYQVDGEESRAPGGSYHNGAEAVAVTACVARLLEGGALREEIGVIAMYDAQRVEIGLALRRQGVAGIQVANVDAFQGQERAYIVVSLTRANAARKLGFVSEVTRTNVALTRAQQGLIVVGNAQTLRSSPMWSRFLQHYASNGAVLHGSVIDSLQPFEIGSARQTATAVSSVAAFATAVGTADCCRLSAATQLKRAEPGHALTKKLRANLLKKGKQYSRFAGSSSECSSKLAVSAWGSVFSTSVTELSVTELTSVLEPNDAIARLVLRAQLQWPSCRAQTIFAVASRLFDKGGGDAVVRAQLQELFPRVTTTVDVDIISACKNVSPVEGLESEDRMLFEASLEQGVDLFEPAKAEGMVQLLHSAQHSTVLTLQAEAETLLTATPRINCSAEGALRKLQFWWRARIVGWMDREQCVRYWQIVHSTRTDRLVALQQLVLEARHPKEYPVVARWHNWDGTRVSKLNTPMHSRVSRYATLNTSGASVIHTRWLEVQRVSWGSQKLKTSADARLSTRFSGTVSAFDRVGPLSTIHRFRPVRDMLCKYGALACSHTQRDPHTGAPNVDGQGRVIKERFMATRETWGRASQVPVLITDYYDEVYTRPVTYEYPELLLLLPCGNPGAVGEACLQVGIHGVITDIEVGDARKYFDELAPKLYGVDGPRVVVQEGDILNPHVRQRAETVHPSATDVLGAYSTPPCTRGSLANELSSTRDPRHRSGDRPPGRGDRGIVGARQEILAEEVARQQADYLSKGRPYFVETTSGTTFEPPPGVVVHEFDEACYGIPMKGRHKVYSPADRPLYIDRLLIQNAERLAKITCPGAARPIQPRERAGGAPMRPPCCVGNIACGYNSGYFVYDKADLARFYGVHVDHASSKERLNNMVPVACGTHHIHLLHAHCGGVRLGLPFVPHDSSCDDPRLGGWILGISDIFSNPGINPALPVVLAVVLATPFSMPGTILTAADGALLTVSVGEGGVFTQRVVDAFHEKYSGATITTSRLVFVGDFLNSTFGAVVVFHTASISCNDKYFLDQRNGGAAQSSDGGRVALRSSVIETIGQQLHASPDKWAQLLYVSLCLAQHAGLAGLQGGAALATPTVEASQVLRAQAVPVTSELIGRAARLVSFGTDRSVKDGMTGAVTSARRKQHVRSQPSTWEPAGSVSLSPMPLVPDRVFSVAAPQSSFVASVFTAGPALRDQYVEARKALFGDRETPESYGLGVKGDRLDAPVTSVFRPAPLSVSAVGLVVVYRRQVVVIGRSGQQQVLPIKALVSRPPLTKQTATRQVTDFTDREAEYRSLFLEMFAAYEFSSKVDRFVESALSGPLEERSWLVSSRDATGRLPSQSVPSHRITLELRRILLADDTDWTCTVKRGLVRREGHEWQLYLPVRRDGLFVPAAVADDQSFGITQVPAAVDSPPFVALQLGFQTVDSFTGNSHQLKISRIHDAVRSLVFRLDSPLQSSPAVANAFVGWPASDSLIARLAKRLETDAKSVLSTDTGLYLDLELDIAFHVDSAQLYELNAGACASAQVRSAAPTAEIYCAPGTVADVLSGKQKALAHVATAQYHNVAAGFLLCIRENRRGLCTWAFVASRTRHDSFVAAFKHSRGALLPRIDHSSAADIEVEYHYFKQFRREYPDDATALKAWRTAMTQPGCVLSWQLTVPPSQLQFSTSFKFSHFLSVGERGMSMSTEQMLQAWQRLAWRFSRKGGVSHGHEEASESSESQADDSGSSSDETDSTVTSQRLELNSEADSDDLDSAAGSPILENNLESDEDISSNSSGPEDLVDGEAAAATLGKQTAARRLQRAARKMLLEKAATSLVAASEPAHDWAQRIINDLSTYPLGRDTTLPITECWRRKRGEQDWILVAYVAESEALRLAGHPGQYGLYCGTTVRGPRRHGRSRLSVRCGETFGNYVEGAEILARSDQRAELEQLGFQFAREGRDGIMMLSDHCKTTPRFMLVDGRDAGGLHLYRANDPKGSGHPPSMEVSPRGVVRALRDCPAFSLSRSSLSENRESEVTFKYGAQFWKGHALIGQPKHPLLVGDVNVQATANDDDSTGELATIFAARVVARAKIAAYWAARLSAVKVQSIANDDDSTDELATIFAARVVARAKIDADRGPRAESLIQYGKLEHVARKDGIQDASLQRLLDYVCNLHIPLETAATPAAATPGTIHIAMGPSGKPSIIQLHTGRSSTTSSHRNSGGQTGVEVLVHLRECLQQIALQVPANSCVAIPWSSGCTVEEWPLWRAEIRNFAIANPELRFVIVQRLSDTFEQAARKRHAKIVEQHKVACAWWEAGGQQDGTQKIGQQLLSSLRDQALEVNAEGLHSQASSLAQAAASVLTQTVEKERTAREAQESQNQAIDSSFRDFVKEQHAAGDISLAEVKTLAGSVAGTFELPTVSKRCTNRRVAIVNLTQNSALNGATGQTDGVFNKSGRIVVNLDKPYKGLTSVNVEHAKLVTVLEATVPETQGL